MARQLSGVVRVDAGHATKPVPKLWIGDGDGDGDGDGERRRLGRFWQWHVSDDVVVDDGNRLA